MYSTYNLPTMDKIHEITPQLHVNKITFKEKTEQIIMFYAIII